MIIQTNAFPARHIEVAGSVLLYFGGTAYLGLQTLPRFQELFIENIKRYGTNYGASRKSNVQLSIFEKAERHLASLVGTEDCMTLSSGYLAGQFMATFFHAPQYTLFYAPNTHSAVYQQAGCVTKSMEELAKKVSSSLENEPAKTPVVFLDSIDFLGKNHPEYKGLRSLPLANVILVVDDSHGIGVLGENGGGTYNSLIPLGAKQTFVCASLGKGFGLQAGAIFGDALTLDQMRATPFYGGASPAGPAALATLLGAEAIYGEQREVLKSHISTFKTNVHDLSPFISQREHPAFSFHNPQLVGQLYQNGIVVTDFSYPSEDAATMSRIILSAHHTTNDVLKLVECINTY